MRRIAVLVGLFTLGTVATASAFFQYWPTRVVASHALRGIGGDLVSTMLVNYIVDERNPATCVMVVYNTETTQFALTAVDPGSCR